MSPGSSEPIEPGGLYSITITGLRDDPAREELALYLASVMRGKTAVELKESLGKLPFLLTRSVSGAVAQKLSDRLQERGAVLDVVSLVPSPLVPGPPPASTAPARPDAEEVFPMSPPAHEADRPEPGPPRGSRAPLPESAARPSTSFGMTIPWEDREEQGFFSSLWETFTGVMFSPSEFYSAMPRKGKVGPAFLYAVLFGVFGLILSAPTVFLTRLSIMRNLPVAAEDLYPLLLGAYTFGVFFSPLFIVLGYFILAVLYHGCILLVGGTGGFEATLKVMAYSASTSIFQVLPYLGGMVSGIYSCGLWVVGFQKAHGLSSGRAVVAVLLPLIVLGVLGVLIVTLLILALGASILQNLTQHIRV